MSDLTDRLRSLTRMEHSDYSIGNEAADTIDRLTAERDAAAGAGAGAGDGEARTAVSGDVLHVNDCATEGAST